MSSPNLLKIISLGFAISIAPLATASMASEAVPEFATKSVSNGKIRAGIAAFNKGSFKKAAFFQEAALKNKLSKSRKLAAYTNLCAAKGALGELSAAATACDAALAISPDSWQALNNKGVVTWLSGDHITASSHFAAAARIAGSGNNLAGQNAKLVAAHKLASAK